jgi:thiopeptide-type bacteriocin biosynthesis protein
VRPSSPARPGYGESLAGRRGQVRHRADAETTRWLQADCGLTSPSSTFWPELASLLRIEGRVDHAFFVRLPWGVRLRLHAVRQSGEVELDLAAWLAGAEQRGVLSSWRFGTYEPQFDRYGGPTGMVLAHQHFDADSRAAIACPNGISRPIYSLTVLNDFIGHSVANAADRLEIWRYLLGLLHQYDGPSGPASDGATVAAALAADPQWLVSLPADAAAAIATARHDNRVIGGRVRAAFAAGQVDAGLRSWLADLAVFHWNRLGLGPVALSPIVGAVVAAPD